MITIGKAQQGSLHVNGSSLTNTRNPHSLRETCTPEEGAEFRVGFAYAGGASSGKCGLLLDPPSLDPVAADWEAKVAGLFLVGFPTGPAAQLLSSTLNAQRAGTAPGG
jgi:hypothetical protein